MQGRGREPVRHLSAALLYFPRSLCRTRNTAAVRQILTVCFTCLSEWYDIQAGCSIQNATLTTTVSVSFGDISIPIQTICFLVFIC
jgi:hypothetical protein